MPARPDGGPEGRWWLPVMLPSMRQQTSSAEGCREVFIKNIEGGITFFIFHVELRHQKKLGRGVSDCLAFLGQKHVFQRSRIPDNLKFGGFNVFGPLYCSFALQGHKAGQG